MCLTLKIMVLIQPLYQLFACIKYINLSFFFILFNSSTSIVGYLHPMLCLYFLSSTVTSKKKIKFQNSPYLVQCLMSFVSSFQSLAAVSGLVESLPLNPVRSGGSGLFRAFQQ